jgi:ribosomal protein L29
MTLPNYKELDKLTTLIEIEKEIFLFTKNLFDLRMKKSTNQSIKPHLFVHTKRRLAQLKFKKLSLLKEKP